MSLRTRTLLTLAVSAALSASLGACTKKKTPSDTVRMRLPVEPPTLDWTLATDNVSKEVIQNLQEGLVQQNADSKVEGATAESWTISNDGLTYTFKLREGVKWSDGQPLVAQHYVDSWERLLNSASAAEYAYFLFDLEGAEDYQKGTLKDFSKVGVHATDDRTLVVKLKRPVAYWIYVPSFWVTFPLRKDVVAKFGDKWTEPGNMLTVGPYVLKDHKRESRISLEANPHYWDTAKLAKMPKKAEFRVVKEDSTAVTLFQGGELDIVRNLPPAQVQALSGLKEFVSSFYLRGYYFGFNLKDPAVADVRIRKALAHAINRDELNSIPALDPRVNPTKSWIPKGLLGENQARGLDYNPELAKKLWAEAPKKPASLELWFDQSEFNKIVAENLQAQWKKVLGVDVQLQNQEWKVYLKTLRSKAPALWRMGWGADYPDPDTFMNLFTCGSGNNFTGMCNKTFDANVTRASNRSTDESRVKAYDEAQKILLEDEVAIVPLFTETNLHLATQRVEGFRVNPMGDFEFKNFHIKDAP